MTIDRIVRYVLLYGFDALSMVIASGALWREPRRSWWIWSAVLLGLGLIARTIYYYQTESHVAADFNLCWKAGSYALEGKDPYSVKGYLPPNDDLPAFVYPPTVLPFFELFALLPQSTAIAMWSVVNVLI